MVGRRVRRGLFDRLYVRYVYVARTEPQTRRKRGMGLSGLLQICVTAPIAVVGPSCLSCI